MYKPTARRATLDQEKSWLGRLLSSLENGSMDGGSTSDIVYIPFLLMLLLFGLMLAIVGFWRVGSSFSTQLGAQAATISSDPNSNILSNLWTAWTGRDLPAGSSVSVDPNTNMVSSSLNGSADFNLNTFGTWQFSVSSGTSLSVRAERFYPGQPTCDGEPCP